MKLSIFFMLSLAVFNFKSYGQINSASKLKFDANEMGAAFIKGDFDTFVKYTYPLVIKSMGGETKLKEIFENTLKEMQQQKMSFSKITFEEPSEIILSGNESQATIAQHSVINYAKGRLVSTTTLIAISIDSGNNWTFIDTSNKDIILLRKALPNLSHLIYIPQQKPPVKYDY